MKTIKLSVTKAFIAVVISVMTPLPSFAGIPVIDGTNLSQNVLSATEAIAQTLKQVQQYSTQLSQYSTQLQQYENMRQNTALPDSFTWANASQTISGLINTLNTLSGFQSQFGSLANYMNNYQNQNQYANSACFNSIACTPGALTTLNNRLELGSQAQQKANAAEIQAIDSQQTALQNDAATLQSLQANAQTASGQMQAIGYANQLASNQANQLLQLRALLIAQQTAEATRNQVIADREAQQAAADQSWRKDTLTPVTHNNWKIR
jgi:P-type conjugative transfer protein TrbJ